MRRRFNYTDRKSLSTGHAAVSLTETGGRYQFDASLNLADLGIPADARVFVEAYFRATRRRFDYGTVLHPIQPNDRSLDSFGDPHAVLFRVKVVSSGGKALLLADADQLSPEDDAEESGSRRSLLHFIAADLGETAWSVQMRDTKPPLLRVNKRLPDPMNMTQTDARFQALVFPGAVRQILHHILVTKEFGPTNDPDQGDRWMNDWLRFATAFAGGTPPAMEGAEPDQDACNVWISRAIDGLSRHLKAVTKADKAFRGE
jgi:hypothetical protein